jgi:hypothetical protein
MSIFQTEKNAKMLLKCSADSLDHGLEGFILIKKMTKSKREGIQLRSGTNLFFEFLGCFFFAAYQKFQL